MNFTARDIVTIIRALERSHITKLEFDGLTIECANDRPTQVQITGEPAQLDPKIIERPLFDKYDPEPEPEPEPEEGISNLIQKEIDDDPMLQEIQRQNLMIEDPQAFELLMDREDIDDATNNKRVEQSVPAE